MSASPLTKDEYIEMQQKVELLSRVILSVDPDNLDQFIQDCEHAETVGPFLDPTAWMQGQKPLRMMIEHARALASARHAIVVAAERGGVLVR